MRPLYHTGRALAIAAGTASTLGALALLLGDPIASGHWRIDHALLPIVVFVTIASGHLTGTALRRVKPISALGFAALFCFGTALTIYQSVGSQHQQTGDKAAAVDAANTAISDKRAEIIRSRARLDQANTMAEREMTGQRCGQRCSDWKTRAAEVTSHIRTLESELTALGAPKSARPRAEAAGDVMAALGYDRARVVTLAELLEPFARSLLLELTAIVAFGYGCSFAGRERLPSGEPAARDGAPSIADSRQTSFAADIVDRQLIAGNQPELPELPEPPKPRRRRQLPANVVDFQPAQRHPVLAAIENAGGSVASNRELARLMAVTEGEASKRVAEVAGQLQIERCGKWNRIRLRA